MDIFGFVVYAIGLGVFLVRKRSLILFGLRRLQARFTPVSTQEGQGLVEYALLLVMVALIVIIILTLVGGEIKDAFFRVACDIKAMGKPWLTCTYEDGEYTFDWAE